MLAAEPSLFPFFMFIVFDRTLSFWRRRWNRRWRKVKLKLSNVGRGNSWGLVDRIDVHFGLQLQWFPVAAFEGGGWQFDDKNRVARRPPLSRSPIPVLKPLKQLARIHHRLFIDTNPQTQKFASVFEQLQNKDPAVQWVINRLDTDSSPFLIFSIVTESIRLIGR
jgi:hypothetical protein